MSRVSTSSVLKSVTTPGVTLIQLQVSYTIWGVLCCWQRELPADPPPAQVVCLTMKPARKDAGMYACVYRTPVPSRVSSDRVVPPQTIARKTLQDMTTTFPPKAGMSTVAPLGNRIGKTDPTREEATCSACLIALLPIWETGSRVFTMDT